MKKHFFAFLYVVLALCFSTAAFAKTVHILSTEAIKYIENPLPNMVVLDVRTKQEYTVGHLPGAILIDFYDPNFDDKLASLDPNVPYLLYCRTGNRTHKSIKTMEKMGFTRIIHMKDGITAWNTNEFPLRYGPPK